MDTTKNTVAQKLVSTSSHIDVVWFALRTLLVEKTIHRDIYRRVFRRTVITRKSEVMV